MPLATTIRLRTAQARTLLAYRRDDWRNLAVVDNGEPLVALPAEHCHPYYCREMKLTDDPTVYLRQGVAELLITARTLLRQADYDLVVLDGWRSVDVQRRLFWIYLKQYTIPEFNLQERFEGAGDDPDLIEVVFDELPEITRQTLLAANRRYVSWPSRDPDRPSPHATGGAVDVWLYRHGQPVNMGVPFDHMAETAGAFYHLRWRRPRFAGDRRVSYHRSLLLDAMLQAGFSVYPGEFWHFNWGNQMHALTTGQPACYSYTEPAA